MVHTRPMSVYFRSVSERFVHGITAATRRLLDVPRRRRRISASGPRLKYVIDFKDHRQAAASFCTSERAACMLYVSIRCARYASVLEFDADLHVARSSSSCAHAQSVVVGSLDPNYRMNTRTFERRIVYSLIKVDQARVVRGS
jgi:hypothetical protein